MIEVEVTKDMVERAKIRAKKMGELRNSITHGAANTAAFIGEEVVLNHLKSAELVDTYDYDIIFQGIKYDVKTKRVNTPPKLNYECSVAELSRHQKCDGYIFVRVLKNFSKAWILGKKTKQDYFFYATKLLKGQVDPSNNFKVRANCYNLPIKDLDDV